MFDLSNKPGVLMLQEMDETRISAAGAFETKIFILDLKIVDYYSKCRALPLICPVKSLESNCTGWFLHDNTMKPTDSFFNTFTLNSASESSNLFILFFF